MNGAIDWVWTSSISDVHHIVLRALRVHPSFLSALPVSVLNSLFSGNFAIISEIITENPPKSRLFA